MMNDMSLKVRIKNIAKEKNISAQSLLQNYLMNHFLYKLSLSEYRDKFVIKGGMLISSIAGIENRSTMDLDATLRNLPLTEESILLAFNEICSIETGDEIRYIVDSIGPIRPDDEYGGYRVYMYVQYGKINAPMTVDVSTGDVITPGATKHVFKDMFDESKKFELWSYPIETVLAEKVEAILSRGIYGTRPRDFYDVYMLSKLDFDKRVFKEALQATATHRCTVDQIVNYEEILKNISESKDMLNRWKVYCREMPYAEGIDYDETLDAVRKLMR